MLIPPPKVDFRISLKNEITFESIMLKAMREIVYKLNYVRYYYFIHAI
jgi:hypothetical protein